MSTEPTTPLPAIPPLPAPVGSAVCKHGRLRRTCDLCEYEEVRASMVETVLVGFDCSENTIKLRLPEGKSIKGLTTGQTIELVLPNVPKL